MARKKVKKARTSHKKTYKKRTLDGYRLVHGYETTRRKRKRKK
jgi:hypothetical protein